MDAPFQITVDTKEFERVLSTYLLFNKKTLSDIIMTKAFYVARNAVNHTDASSKSIVNASLNITSKKYPPAPISAIIAQIKRASKGMKGAYGKEMRKEVVKLISARKAGINYLRAGWIAAIKAIEPYVAQKNGPPYKHSKPRGVAKGGGTVSGKDTLTPTAMIFNSVSGAVKFFGLNKKTETANIQLILEDGLKKAVEQEVRSMEAYIKRKLNP